MGPWVFAAARASVSISQLATHAALRNDLLVVAMVRLLCQAPRGWHTDSAAAPICTGCVRAPSQPVDSPRCVFTHSGVLCLRIAHHACLSSQVCKSGRAAVVVCSHACTAVSCAEGVSTCALAPAMTDCNSACAIALRALTPQLRWQTGLCPQCGVPILAPTHHRRVLPGAALREHATNATADAAAVCSHSNMRHKYA